MIDFDLGVSLSPIERTDLVKLYGWRNHPAIRKWTRQCDLITWPDHEEWFEWQAKDDKTRMYLVYAKDPVLLTMAPVGVTGLTSIDWINKRAEFSLYIGPEYQGRRFGQRALRTLLSHGFRNFGLHLIWGESFDGNPALKMFKKIGFQNEGVRRDFYFREGRFIDAHLVSITEKEWQSRCSY